MYFYLLKRIFIYRELIYFEKSDFNENLRVDDNYIIIRTQIIIDYIYIFNINVYKLKFLSFFCT